MGIYDSIAFLTGANGILRSSPALSSLPPCSPFSLTALCLVSLSLSTLQRRPPTSALLANPRPEKLRTLAVAHRPPPLPRPHVYLIGNNQLNSGYDHLDQAVPFHEYIYQNLHAEGNGCFTDQGYGERIIFRSEFQSIPPRHSEIMDIDNDSNAKDAIKIQDILKSRESAHEVESILSRCKFEITEGLVVQVLRRHRSDWKPALFFFDCVSRQGYAHGSRSYNELLDILGRMRRLKEMQRIFDEIPKERIGTAINERTFAILVNRYAASHKIESAIEVFYKRKRYGFECNIAAFQTLLVSLCRYKHVEEAEALFLQTRDEFPPSIKTWNIILNGWRVLGNSREARRIWNDIILSKCKPDLFTYGIFINSLAKAGKLGSAVKLFSAMRNEGLNPDVTICNCIIDALCFKKKIPQALEIFGEMNEPDCLPDTATYNSLIKHICKIRRMEKVYELLDEMERKGCQPNARTYSYILKTMKKPEEVTELLYKMETTGCGMNGDTYNLVLNLYVHWDYQEGIRSIWSEMERKGLGPDQRSYTIIIHGLYNQGKLDEAMEYFNKMSFKGMNVEPRTRLLIEAVRLKNKGKFAKHGNVV
ncbi:Putative pentatricopeptide repeat-containing protein [Apostasia shenzhenica]|uniref:Pentatricopeptide repeat-containing protein n=1 Tax=Apostasia shenzhenica TaxID=1088818 RepID=A0A2I0AC80_9ASPA|nr:Putative pentatricopeptide repeat-containing protein [Apostasia shenzhenica]